MQLQEIQLPHHGLWVPGSGLWLLLWNHQRWGSDTIGHFPWGQTQHLLHDNGCLKRTYGHLRNRPADKDLGHDAFSGLQSCHWLFSSLIPPVSVYFEESTLCTATYMHTTSPRALPTLLCFYRMYPMKAKQCNSSPKPGGGALNPTQLSVFTYLCYKLQAAREPAVYNHFT